MDCRDLGNKRGLVKSSLQTIFGGVRELIGTTDTHITESATATRERFTVISCLAWLDSNKYGKLLKDLAHQNAQGSIDVYLKNSVNAYRLLTYYHTNPKNLGRLLNGAHFDYLSFSQMKRIIKAIEVKEVDKIAWIEHADQVDKLDEAVEQDKDDEVVENQV